MEDDGKVLHITPVMSISPELFTQPLTLLIDKDSVPAMISAGQNGISIKIRETDLNFMLDVSPSEGTVICRYK